MNLIYQLKWKLLIPKLKKIKLIVFDVDGVLTDGGLWYNSKGELTKRFNVKDGLGIRLIQELGVEVVFLSGGKAGSTEIRAQQLKVKHCLVEVKDKFRALTKLQQKLLITKENTCFVGDDINDITVRDIAKLFFVPNDSCQSIKNIADLVLKKNGGMGAAREIADRLLEAYGKYEIYSKIGWSDNNS
jgi:3-deoxy-D-manno-octulosonate 8-phosphate phosphatase (KDO 8-P phosphatase)|tara:strand:+ start:13424 stop:13984 length:561 start_codon:yes stop_codon:yes gene_type:complete